MYRRSRVSMRIMSPGLTKRGTWYGGPGFQLRRFRRPGRGITLEAGIGLLDLQLDVGRQVDADRGPVVELDGDPHPVFEEVGRVADQLALEGDVLVALGVHEVVAVGIVVEHLHVAVVDGRAFQLFAGPERTLDGRPGLDVLEPGPHEGRALPGLHVEELDDGPKLTVDHDRDAVPKIVRGNHVRAELAHPGGLPLTGRKSGSTFSVPARSRPMFARCMKTMRSAEASAVDAAGGAGRGTTASGAIAIARQHRAGRGVARQASTVASQTTAKAPPAGHASAMTAPKFVATPLPPRKLRNGEKQ